MLSVTVSIKRMQGVTYMKWYEHVLQREEDNILPSFEFSRKYEQKTYSSDEKKNGLRKEDAPSRKNKKQVFGQ